MVSNDIAHQVDSKDVHTELLGTLPDLDLTLGQFELTLQGQKVCFEPARRGRHNGVIFIFLFL